MATALSDITNLVNDRRRDTSANSIDMTTVGFRAINSTIQIWNEIHDWPWTIKTQNFNYNPGIYTYTLPSDFKFPLTIKNYKPNQLGAEYWLVSPLKFDSAIQTRRFAISNIAGVQYLRMKSIDGNIATVNAATAYNQGGTWIGGGAISGVTTDNYEGFTYPSSVKFNFSGGTTGTLTNSTMTPMDLSAFKDRSASFFDIYLASVSNFTSITYKWGTDASNYYTVTVTSDYLGIAFAASIWSKMKFAWSSPTTVGTPTDTSIGYVQITLTYSVDPASTSYRFQNIIVSENVPIVLTYYSVNMVSTTGGSQSQLFASSGATTDYPLWSGRWDAATEPFINSVLEIIFWMTGEYNDMGIARQKIVDIVTPLRTRYPSQRRYPTLQFVTDTNYQN